MQPPDKGGGGQLPGHQTREEEGSCQDTRQGRRAAARTHGTMSQKAEGAGRLHSVGTSGFPLKNNCQLQLGAWWAAVYGVAQNWDTVT